MNVSAEAGDSAHDSRVMFALDVADLERAEALALSVRDAVGVFKIGLELFVQAGPAAVAIGREHGRPIFLDLKLHDIPETVERAVAGASQLGARWLTVHGAGGRGMLRRAASRARDEGAGLEIVAVTVLTSLDDADLRAGGIDEGVASHAERLARLAWEEGVRCFVCSPLEVARLRAAFGSAATLITPGVRASSSAGRGDDQKRTWTAAAAVANGADWVVVGRPIRDAADPAAAARDLSREVAVARTAASRTPSEPAPRLVPIEGRSAG